jgi:VCBS repeat-containing protein
VLQVNDANDGVLGNDRDPEGDPITVVSNDSTSQEGAIIVMQSDGTFTYDPRNSTTLQQLNIGDSLADVFQYVASDPQGHQATGTVTVNVSGLNDAPIAEDDVFQALPNQTTDLTVTANDSDVDGTIDTGSILVLTGPFHGTATTRTDGSIRYTPNPSYSGSDAITYVVRDNSGTASNVGTVRINVNSPPIAIDDVATAFDNGPSRIEILANDSDIDGFLVPSTVDILQSPQHGTADLQPDGSIIYLPDSGYLGSDSFTYTVEDDDEAVSNVASVAINVIRNPHPWQNPLNRFDVNADTIVSPIDALILINELTFGGARNLPVPPIPPEIPPPYLDPNADDSLTPADAFDVISFLNNVGNAGGEGESSMSLNAMTPHEAAAPADSSSRQVGDERDQWLKAAEQSAGIEVPLVGEANSDASWQLRGVLAGQADWHSDSLEDTLKDIVDDVNWDDLDSENLGE